MDDYIEELMELREREMEALYTLDYETEKQKILPGVGVDSLSSPDAQRD